MAMDAGEVERLIKAKLRDAKVTIRDLVGDGEREQERGAVGAHHQRVPAREYQRAEPSAFLCIAATQASGCSPIR